MNKLKRGIDMSKHPLIFLIILCLSACGKYGSPVPPEALSPRGVQELNVTAELEGVRFNWKAPDLDLRGKELRSMDGYRVLKIEGSNPLGQEMSIRAEIPDNHVSELQKLKKAAMEQGKIVRRVKVDDQMKKFEFLDKQVTSGKTYTYQIVPVNQDGVLGEASKFVRVLFKGDQSDILMIDPLELDQSDNIF